MFACWCSCILLFCQRFCHLLLWVEQSMVPFYSNPNHKMQQIWQFQISGYATDYSWWIKLVDEEATAMAVCSSLCVRENRILQRLVHPGPKRSTICVGLNSWLNCRTHIHNASTTRRLHARNTRLQSRVASALELKRAPMRHTAPGHSEIHTCNPSCRQKWSNFALLLSEFMHQVIT